MRTTEVLRMAVHNLWQRQVRTLFNLTGIVTGCVVLLMTAAGTYGTRNAIHALFDSSDFARQIYIFPGGFAWEEPPEGEIVIDAEMSEVRRERIRLALASQWNEARRNINPRYDISTDELDSIRKLPHVIAVVPEVTTNCSVQTDADSISSGITTMSIHSSTLRQSLLAGALPDAGDREGVLVDEFLAWQMGFRNDTDLPKLVGQKITIEYRVAKNRVANIYNSLAEKWGQLGVDDLQQQVQFLQTFVQLMGDLDNTSLNDDQKAQLRSLIGSGIGEPGATPDVLETREFTVCGIFHTGDSNPVAALFRQWFHIVRSGLQVHPDVALEIYESQSDANSFYNATVFVESSIFLREVTSALQAEHFNPQSSLAILEHIDIQIEQSAWVIYGIAIAVLLTASVGISNTLILSIVERTPEFGIMKSLGARDSHILKLMIAEGALLGLVGAGFAILLSLLIGACGQSLLKMYVESRTQTELAGSLFQFQLLPMVLVLLISVTLCVVASLLPAWRAARLDPVVAMRRT